MTILSCKEIGGYFELELDKIYNNCSDSVFLNTAKNCLRYVIKAFCIKEIYVPYYTCPVVYHAIKRENCKIIFYNIDKNFLPTIDFPLNAFVLYTNYFGICASNIKKLAQKYKNLIVDNAQAFYMPKYGIASFNSIRKFFGVPDGALLKVDKLLDKIFEQDSSYQRMAHLLKRIDVNAQFGYEEFCKNENILENEEIKYASNLTKVLFNSINLENCKKQRLQNFHFFQEHLSMTNELSISLDKDDVPMVYPYLIKDENLRSKLIKNRIYIATYWVPQPFETQEYIFQKYLIPLPIDQRYTLKDLERVMDVIYG